MNSLAQYLPTSLLSEVFVPKPFPPHFLQNEAGTVSSAWMMPGQKKGQGKYSTPNRKCVSETKGWVR